jgi:hypothetical protein
MSLVLNAYSDARFDIYKCEIGNHNVHSIRMFQRQGFTRQGPVEGDFGQCVSVYTRPKDLGPQPQVEGKDAASGPSSASARPVNPE